LSATRDQNWHIENTYSEATALDEHLRRLHALLAVHDLEFGHRVFYEANRFAALHAAAGDMDAQRILDRILMQKILPRLHGSRRKLEAPLLSLAHFAFYGPTLSLNETDTAKLKVEDLNSADAVLMHSFDKIRRMIRGLRANQFASFTE
jgi:5-methylcytosine-specific restriction protein B